MSVENVQSYSLFTDFDISLFSSGKHFKLYEKMGNTPIEIDGKAGIYFAVWAPNAKEVAVMGSFNGWNRKSHQLNAALGWVGYLGRFYSRGIGRENFINIPLTCENEIYRKRRSLCRAMADTTRYSICSF